MTATPARSEFTCAMNAGVSAAQDRARVALPIFRPTRKELTMSRTTRTSTQPEAQATPASTSYGFHAHLGKVDFATTVERVTAALKQEGFGVLTEIDVKATMKNKLGIDVPPHRILGACNPSLAHRALTAEPDIGLLLPRNAVVRTDADGDVTVGFIDPIAMLQRTDNPEVAAVAREAGERLQRMRNALVAS